MCANDEDKFNQDFALSNYLNIKNKSSNDLSTVFFKLLPERFIVFNILYTMNIV